MKQVFFLIVVFQFLGQSALRAEIIATPDTLRFGPTRTGTSVMDSVVVVNRGQADLAFSSVDIDGTAFHLPDDLHYDEGVTLPPEQGIGVKVRFAPEDQADYSSTLTIGIGSGVLSITLEGEGVREVVVIQEVLADPPADADGDANRDGTRHSAQDEFVELLNIGFRTVELSGWQLTDAGTAPASRFTFPDNTELGPGERVVLFGGGSPTGFSGSVFADDGSIGGGLRNGGDSVFLIDPTVPDTIASAAYGSEGNKNQSLVRQPEGRGPFVLHSAFPGDGALFSPGRARSVIEPVEVAPGDTSAAPIGKDTGQAPVPSGSAGARVVIDEILADPAAGPPGDANRDGVRDGKADEFVEIWNVDSKPVTIGGWWLSDDDVGTNGRFYFPEGLVLEPGMRAVLFGGGNPRDLPGPVFVDDGSIGNGLTNKGDLVLLVDPVSDDTVAVARFQVAGDLNRSVVRFAEGVYVPHPDLPGGGGISPGLPHPRPAPPGGSERSLRPEFLDAPPSWCRVGALCRFAPRIRNLNGGFVHLETRAQGVVWDRFTGEIRWRPDKEGRFRFWQTAVSGSGAKTVRQFDVRVEPRPQIAIVEILADPPPGPAGDVNRDGTRDSQADEFVEIQNRGPAPVWITDWRLSDDDVSSRRQFRFPEFSRLHPGERAVLFGGGRPEGFEGQVFVDDGSIGNGLTNTADVILLIDPVLNDTLARATYNTEDDIDQSLVWDGDGWVPHRTPPGKGAYSPGLPSESGMVFAENDENRQTGGTDSDGAGPNAGDAGPDDPSGPAAVIISEILANPASGTGGDANADGERHGYRDEFVELWNTGPDTARLEGCRLGDDDTPWNRMFGFPAGTMLPPEGFLVLFGGGTLKNFTGAAFADDGRIGDGLSNSGDTVFFLSPDGEDTLDAVSFGSAPSGTSLVRHEDATLHRHDLLPYTGLISPGRAAPLLVAIRVVPDTIGMEPGSIRTVAANGLFDSEDLVDVTDELTWIVEDSTVARLEPGFQLRALAPGETSVHARFGRVKSQAVVSVFSEKTDESGDPDDPYDEDSGGADSAANLPPVILSRPDTLVIAGLKYAYLPVAEDPEGDSVVFFAPRKPAWLHWTGSRLDGTPEDAGLWPVAVGATDGRDTTEQAFTIQVVRPGASREGRPDSIAYVGVTWRLSLDLGGGIQVQAEGGPVPEASGESLVWRPQSGDEGRREITVSMSGHGSASLVLTFRIMVHPRPQIKVTEILVDPVEDVSGDGTLDRFGDQFIELFNPVEFEVDLSDWTLGDDDGKPFEFPRGTVLNGGERLTLFGGGLREVREGRFSAGGRIGNGLDEADRLLLIAPDGPDTLVETRYTGGLIGASLVPDPKNPGGWLPHNQISSLLFSPGLATPAADSAAAHAENAANGVESLPAHPFPNPFNIHTTIGFRSTGDPAELTVYNILGQPVRRFPVADGAGFQQLVWDGCDDLGRPVGTGVYLIRIRNGLHVRTMRVVLVK